MNANSIIGLVAGIAVFLVLLWGNPIVCAIVFIPIVLFVIWGLVQQRLPVKEETPKNNDPVKTPEPQETVDEQ